VFQQNKTDHSMSNYVADWPFKGNHTLLVEVNVAKQPRTVNEGEKVQI